uniref:Gag protein n=1 Tax=Heterorhabditis bacteriophora TaxID=37862 RepID=A0A1I7XND9_HETBA
MAPTLRARAGSTGPRPTSVVTDIQSQIVAPLKRSLSDMDDEVPARGQDMKTLREDATSSITLAWKDAQAQLNASFEEVGRRINRMPRIAVSSIDPASPRIIAFNGAENTTQFSVWLRRLEDVWRMHSTTESEKQKAYFLIGHLDGVAREKVKELPEDNITEESAALFANKILSLVRAATAGQDPLVQNERALEEFISRLRADVRYYVKLDNANTFEAAVAKAQTVEQLLAEATAERLINPASVAPDIAVNTVNPRMNSSLQNYNE